VIQPYLVSLLSLTLLLTSVSSYADGRQAKEHYVKTAFLYNFARLAEWPQNTFANNENIQICLIGKDNFGDALSSIKDKKVRNQALTLHRHIKFSDITQCHMLFISQSEKTKVQKILNLTKNHAILTISELSDFAQHGGHIRLFLNAQSTLSLEINLVAIKHSGIKISSRILTLATIVSSSDKGGDK
jgi:hypothetical protein